MAYFLRFYRRVAIGIYAYAVDEVGFLVLMSGS